MDWDKIEKLRGEPEIRSALDSGGARALKAALDGDPAGAGAIRSALLSGDAEAARRALERLLKDDGSLKALSELDKRFGESVKK